LIALDSTIVNKLLTAINECMDWGQVFILDTLTEYTPGNSAEAESIIERVLPRIQHINNSVVMSAIKVILYFMSFVKSPEIIRALCEKITPPLSTSYLCFFIRFPVLASLIDSVPEVSYCVLRNLHFIMQKYPTVMQKEFKHFFCKYGEPLYVKFDDSPGRHFKLRAAY
jgi:AP-1 complex subunit beta-1